MSEPKPIGELFPDVVAHLAALHDRKVDGWLLDVFVPGVPRPQGSKKSLGPRRMVESSVHVGPWRERVAWFSVQALVGVAPIERLIPVVTSVEFVMPRPGSAPKKSTPPAIRQPD